MADDPTPIPHKSSGLFGLWSELKRRHVVRVAMVYAVVGWLVIQVANATFADFGIPVWASRFVVLMVVLGFPISLVVAWAFELTPEGIKTSKTAREEHPDSHKDASHAKKRSWLAYAIGAALPTLILGILALIFYFQAKPEESDLNNFSSTPSIAVLPFENRSGNEEDRYFTDGMHDELRTRLAKISGLKVLSRSSVEEYRDSPKSRRIIGEELEIDYVLEGSVQRVAGRVRVSIELIDTDTESQVWANLYDRELTTENLLNIQSEVAQTVGSELGAVISTEESYRIAKRSTDNLQAYDFYLRAFALSNVLFRGSQDTLDTAQKFYEEALRLDPSFALAHVGLADIHSWAFLDRWDGYEDRGGLALASAESALELEPDLPEAHHALAAYYYRVERNYPRALDAIRMAESGLRGESSLALLKANVHRRAGQWEDARRSYERANSLDPRSAVPLRQLGLTYLSMRLYEDSEAAFERAFRLAPNRLGAKRSLAWSSYYLHGDTKILKGVLDEELNPDSTLIWRWRVEFLKRDWSSALSILDRSSLAILESQHSIIPVSLCRGWTYAAFGDTGAAEKAFKVAVLTLTNMLSGSDIDDRLYRSLGLAYAGLGQRDAAIKEGQLAWQLLPTEKDVLHGPFNAEGLAMIYAQLGEIDLAVEELRKLLSIPGRNSINLIDIDPRYDSIRQHPEYSELLEEFGSL